MVLLLYFILFGVGILSHVIVPCLSSQLFKCLKGGFEVSSLAFRKPVTCIQI